MQATRQDMPPVKDLKPIANFLEMLGGATTQTAQLWIKKGVYKGTVRLRAWMLNGWHTSEAEVLDFINRKTDAALRKGATPATSPAIQKRLKAANKRLAAKGVKVKSK